MNGFLLGLANGTSCMLLCAPVLIPFLLGRGESVRQSSVVLLQFLGGRLGGYILFGLLAWGVGGLLRAVGEYQTLLTGGTYVGLSALLLLAVFAKQSPAAEACSVSQARKTFRHFPFLIPAGMGLLTGLKICPPLLLAFAVAATSQTLGGSLLLFLAFFTGTSIYFLPLPLLGVFSRMPDLRIVGRFASAIVAVYYLASGILLFAGGASL